MTSFPVQLLRPLAATIRGRAGAANLRVPLAPFDLHGERIETALALDAVAIPVVAPKLTNRTFRFPMNPRPGYIDASVYIQHAHHPIDVTEISFGRVDAEGLHASLTMVLRFDFEGLYDYAATNHRLEIVIGMPGRLTSVEGVRDA